MEWTSLDTWIVVIGTLSAVSCALVGNYLVLRKMSMMGDAISHTVLPGIVIAFMVTKSLAALPMFLGAIVIGIATALLVQLISRSGKVDEGASMGIVFTTLFAIGLILIRQVADDVDLDPSCVLYGAIETAPLSTAELFGFELPRAAVSNGLMLLLNVAFITLCYKELKISSFDPALATTLGINANLMHYLLMIFVAATTVAAFESVGSILVIAMLIVPAAAAHLLTDRLPRMLLLSAVIAALSAFTGHVSAIVVPGWFGYRDTSTAGMMAVMAGVIFFIVFLFAPRYGLVSRAGARLLLSLRISREDVLALLYRRAEVTPESGPAGYDAIRASLPGNSFLRLALQRLQRSGSVRRTAQGYSLTDAGREDARVLIRSHRLWESYLVSEMGIRPDHVHGTAERLEHVTDPAMQAELLRETGAPRRDPHEREIPGK